VHAARPKVKRITMMKMANIFFFIGFTPSQITYPSGKKTNGFLSPTR